MTTRPPSNPSAADGPTPAGSATESGEPNPEAVARSVALRKLAAAPQSRAQLAEVMARQDVPDEVARKVLDRFEEVELIDDAAYAEMLVRSKHRERGLARRGLAEELRRKGIDRDVAEEALEAITAEDEAARALDLVLRKARSSRGVEYRKRRRRLMGMLARKGYGPSVAYRAIDEVLGEEELSQDDGSTGP